MSDGEMSRAGIKSMPGSLGEALQNLSQSKIMKEILGDHVYNNFLTVKQREWDEFRCYVTEWELKRYLNIL